MALLLAPTSTVWAGWGYAWCDLRAASPDGRYLLKATKYAGPKRPTYFHYRLHDRTGKTFWERDDCPANYGRQRYSWRTMHGRSSGWA